MSVGILDEKDLKWFEDRSITYGEAVFVPATFEERALDRQVAKLVLGEPNKPKRLRRRSPNRVMGL